jgi:hypothetical protein
MRFSNNHPVDFEFALPHPQVSATSNNLPLGTKNGHTSPCPWLACRAPWTTSKLIFEPSLSTDFIAASSPSIRLSSRAGLKRRGPLESHQRSQL